LSSIFSVNVLASGIVASWCREHKSHLVQISSIAVHGSTAERAGPECPVLPDTDYARSKLDAEMLVESSGCASAVVRVAGIFGSRGPDHLGLNRAIRLARDGVMPSVIGSGRGLRNYVHVDDAAEILVDVAERRLQGLFWVGGCECLSIGQMMQAVCDVFLPGASPNRKSGAEARDQIVDVSDGLKPSRRFIEALRSEL
jgi:nucleoside-diphosphate-sugar epimerase